MRWFIVLLILANLVLFFWLQRDSLPDDTVTVLPPPDIGRLELLAEGESPADYTSKSAKSTDLLVTGTEPTASAADSQPAIERPDLGEHGTGTVADVQPGIADTMGAAPVSTSSQTAEPTANAGAEAEPAFGGSASTGVPDAVPALRQNDDVDEPAATGTEPIASSVPAESLPVAESEPVVEPRPPVAPVPGDPTESAPVADSDPVVEPPPSIEPVPSEPTESMPVAESDPVVESPPSIAPVPGDPTDSTSVAESEPVVEVSPSPSPSPSAEPAVCAQIGPLTPEQSQALVAELPVFVSLLSEAVEEVRTVEAYYVMIPPLQSRAEGLAVLQALDDAGITDTWLFRRGRFRNAISLGLFNRRSGALRRLNDVGQRGFEAEVVERATTEQRRRLLLKNIDGGDLALSLPLPEGVSAEPQPCP